MHHTPADSPGLLPTEHLPSLYRVLSLCNSAIVQSASQQELFQLVCDAVLQMNGVKAARVGLLQANSQPVQDVPVAAGLHVAAALPLQRAGLPVAVLSIYADTAHAFDRPSGELLQQIADSVSHALDLFEQTELRQKAEASQRQTQALTQRFIDQLPGTVYLKDSQFRMLMLNKNLGRVLNVDPQTLLGKSNQEIFPADFAATITALDQQMLEQGGSRTVEEVFQGRHLETTMFVVDDESGQKMLGGISLDVTERVEAAALTKALLRINELGGRLPEKEFLKEGLELAEMLTHSTMGFLHFVNDDQETLELITWTSSTLRGCQAAFDAHYPISSAGIWADCFRQRKPVVFNDYAAYDHKKGLPQGHTVLNRLISVPVIEGEQVRMMIGVGNKLTDYDTANVEALRLIGNDLWRIASRARTQRSLKHRVEELVTVNQELTQTQLKLVQSEKMASIGQLAAGVAHEINNPIGFVKSNFSTMATYVDDLLSIVRAYDRVQSQMGPALAPAFDAVNARKRAADHDFLVTDLKQLIHESRDGVERISKIVHDLKDFSRAGNNDWQWTDLHQGLESTLGMAWNELKYKAEVTREFGELPAVYCLSSQINQVVLNLLVNAAHAIPQRGKIIVRTGTDGATVWIEVQDNGCGMSAQQLTHMFEPFYTTKPVGQGTGLGLSIAWSIINRHHGKITVASQPNQGSTFKIVLPVDHRQLNPTDLVEEKK